MLNSVLFYRLFFPTGYANEYFTGGGGAGRLEGERRMLPIFAKQSKQSHWMSFVLVRWSPRIKET